MEAHRRFPVSPKEDPYGSTTMPEKEKKAWDTFQDPPREPTVGSSVKSDFLDSAIKCMKVATIIGTFCLILGFAMLSKGTLLFMTSQIQFNITRGYCNKDIDPDLQLVTTLPIEERVVWIWLLIFAYFVPEVGTFLRSIRKCVFKKWSMPTAREFLVHFGTEICPAIGSAVLIFAVLPELDVIKGAMLTNAVCFIPGVVAMFTRKPQGLHDTLKMVLDVVSIVAQASCFVVWPLIEERPILYCIPLSVLLISVGWWKNFVAVPQTDENEDTSLSLSHRLESFDEQEKKSEKGPIDQEKEMETKTYFIYIFIAPVKCLLFFATTLVIFYLREDDFTFLFEHFDAAFQDHPYNVTEIAPIIPGSENIYEDVIATGKPLVQTAYAWNSLTVFLINIVATYMCYAVGKFSCKVMIQNISFAFSINLAVPVVISGLIGMCGAYLEDICAFSHIIPNYLFFQTPPLDFLTDFVSHQHAWIWLIWLLSQVWITMHIWFPNCDRLARTEQLFERPMYDAFLIDQSLAMNRRRNEKPKDKVIEKGPRDIKEVSEDENKIVRIYACGTMWHETKPEMLEFLKSIMRLDQEQGANRIVRDYLQIHIDEYYELETHVFFDDAFVRTYPDDPDPHVNSYVTDLVSIMNEAAVKVHGTHEVCILPPKIYPTPYGGRLVWMLPGKTKMIAHLKDKKKIRAKKRWSQVMYMYYLLGYRLGMNKVLTPCEKDLRATRTFILALDGDIDFQPDALRLLIDYMKKDRQVGAACGRIHPVGSGAMVWYQLFEYAVGHWMQKATEHVIGCVLCSPGCFSLFRGSALMDESVMKKYTTRPSEAKHFVQYDQGEDRWLCTLLLQQGHRVEYSAASDAFTHCPEGFNEFYNQRRRWMPSTMANILDLLMDYEHTVKRNENISTLYVFYQLILMIGTVLGPGTIFLMLVGAFVAAFGMDQFSSFVWNLVPILLFVVICATCSSDVQLFFAGLISAVYGLIMMAVFVGVALQIAEDGFLAPSSLFFFCVAAEFIIAAILHPQEFYCLKYGVVYYVTVPSMYMLLVIYSVFNMNNISWGTRDVTVVPTGPKSEEEKKAEDEAPKKAQTKKDKVLSFFGADSSDNSGVLDFSMSKLFRCMFCTYREEKPEDEALVKIQESIAKLTDKLDGVEKSRHEPVELLEPTLKPTIMDGSKANIRNDLDDQSSFGESEEIIENSWFYDGDLHKGEVHYLGREEETFWQELLEEYLHPVEDDKEKLSADLKDLRDKMVSTFFMLNSLFVLVIFLLTLKKDLLHIDWPVNPKINFTYINDNNEVHVYVSYLQLEPIGFVFVIFFALLLVIQFFAMLIHRFATFSQIVATTHLDFSSNKADDLSELSIADIKSKDPVKMVKNLAQFKGLLDPEDNASDMPISQRKTFSRLPVNHFRKSVAPVTMDDAFAMRLESNADATNTSDERRKSMAFVKQRMNTVSTRPSAMPFQAPRMSRLNASMLDLHREEEPEVEA